MATYAFVTYWTVDAPLEKVWDAIFESEKWPLWWRGVKQVRTIKPGSPPYKMGSVTRSVWKSLLPYRLIFNMTVTRVDYFKRIESSAMGELEGTGIWTFSQQGTCTLVQYDWNVRTTELWMNLLAPIARPFFRWNHDLIMGWGEVGLKKYLDAS